MSRKPADQMNDMASSGQDGVWAYIREHQIFSVRGVADATGIPRRTVDGYIKRLLAGGYVEGYGDTQHRLVRDVGVHAPRVNPQGQPVTQGSGTQNMWRSMRMLKQFSPIDIQAHSSTDLVEVSLDTAKKYCSALLAAKYLRVVKKAVPGKSQAVYQLIQDTGPKPPRIQRVKRVFDQNLGKVMAGDV